MKNDEPGRAPSSGWEHPKIIPEKQKMIKVSDSPIQKPVRFFEGINIERDKAMKIYDAAHKIIIGFASTQKASLKSDVFNEMFDCAKKMNLEPREILLMGMIVQDIIFHTT